MALWAVAGRSACRAERAMGRLGTGRRGFAVLGLLAALLAPDPGRAENTGELVDRSALRVCADPDDLPFSNEAGEGFENKIAQLMAQRLGVQVEYTWYPQSMGFVRNTLHAQLCDLIMGTVTADELVQNSNPYYHSTYVMVVRNEDKERLAGFGSPDFATARFGVIAGSPPADLLLRNGLMGRAQAYNLIVDTRVEKPNRQMLQDLRDGVVDVGLMWGPIAGYYLKRDNLPFTMTPLQSDPRSQLRMDFRIAMGMRQNEPQWKQQVNMLIRELQPEINRVLLDFGVPLLDEQGRPLTAALPQAATVPEPSGYRMERYRAPVPATLTGATVLDTEGLQQLVKEAAPVVVDVLPKPRKPANRDPNQLWMDPKRDAIPGAVWLPNTGYGELTPEYRKYFEETLDKLTAGTKDRPLVFYCDRNCWMSWNAAKRAVAELGYTRVYWYPDGLQGWQSAGLATEPAQEIPAPEAAQ
jgi:quinoprotein dehydrogenase-associated probable ABC transporter substrate-binding protein/PQQ-dependent catabolism-associated CXXCW motif protein